MNNKRIPWLYLLIIYLLLTLFKVSVVEHNIELVLNKLLSLISKQGVMIMQYSSMHVIFQ